MILKGAVFWMKDILEIGPDYEKVFVYCGQNISFCPCTVMGDHSLSLSLLFVNGEDEANSHEVCGAGALSPAWNPSVAFSASDSAS